MTYSKRILVTYKQSETGCTVSIRVEGGYDAKTKAILGTVTDNLFGLWENDIRRVVHKANYPLITAQAHNLLN